MSTILSPKTITAPKGSSNYESEFILYKLRIIHFILGALVIAISFYNVWLGLTLGAAYIIFMVRKWISFICYILTLDFELDKDIISDLESI